MPSSGSWTSGRQRHVTVNSVQCDTVGGALASLNSDWVGGWGGSGGQTWISQGGDADLDI